MKHKAVYGLCFLLSSIVCTAQAPLKGDIAPRGLPDNKLDSRDLLLLQHFVLGKEQPTANEMILADVAPLGTPDGKLDAADIVVMERALHRQVTLQGAALRPTLSIESGATTYLASYPVTGTATPNAKVNLYVNGVLQGVVQANETGLFTISAPLSVGANNIYTTVQEGGQQSPASAVITIERVDSESQTAVAVVDGQGSVTSDGAAIYEISLSIASGSGHIQPDLGLRYNSRGGNGLVGVGWKLSGLSAITRCRPTYSQDGTPKADPLSNEERFCLNGERLILVNGSAYGGNGAEYRTEINSMSRIRSYGTAGSGPAYFIIETESGQTIEYGRSPDSRIEAQNSSEVAVWNVNKVSDAFSNYYTVSYYENNASGEYYPQQINYSGNDDAGVSPTKFILLNYRDRPVDDETARADQVWGYLGQTYQSASKLLEQVVVYHNGVVVKEYQLDYQQSMITGKSRLSQIEECGYNEMGTTKICALPTVLSWEETTPAYSAPTAIGGFTSTDTARNPLLLDINGDGLDDLLWGDESNRCWFVRLGNDNSEIAFSPQIVIQESCNRPMNGGHYYPWYSAKPFLNSGKNTWGLLECEVRPFTTPEWFTMAKHICAPIYFEFDSSGGFLVESQNGITNVFPNDGTVPLVWDANSDGLSDTISVTFSNNAALPITTMQLNGLPESGGSTAPEASWSRTLPYSVKFWGGQKIDFGDGYPDYFVKSIDSLDIDQYEDYYQEYYDVPKAITGWARIRSHGDSISYEMVPDFEFGAGEQGNGIALDLNNDGLKDWVFKSAETNTWKIRINRGGEELTTNTFAPAIDTGITSGGDPNHALPIDYDNDGISDLLVQHPTENRWRILLSIHEVQDDGSITPNFAIRDTDFASYGYIEGVPLDPNLVDYLYVGDTTPIIADINHDNQQDIMYLNEDNGQWYVLYREGDGNDVLASVSNGLGVKTQFTYSALNSSVNYEQSTSVYPQRSTRKGIVVVESMAISNGIDGFTTLHYGYQNARVDVLGRGFLGFSRRTITNETAGLVAVENYHQDFPFTGRVYRQQTLTIPGNTLISQTGIEWQVHQEAGAIENAVRPVIARRWVQNYDLATGQTVSARLIENTYDGYAAVTSQKVTTGKTYDESSGVIANIEAVTTVVNTITNDLVNRILGFVGQRTVTYERPSEAARTVTHSFQQYAGTLRAEAITAYQGTDVWNTSTFTYDDFGNQTEVEVSGASTTARRVVDNSNYSDNLYPQSIENALQQESLIAYDKRFGVAKTITDANGLTTNSTYDEFGRLQAIQSVDGTESSRYFSLCDTQCPGLAAYSVSLEVSHPDAHGAWGAPKQTVYFDKLGRRLRTETIGPNGLPLWVDITYDAQGRIARSSNPYFSGDTPVWTEFDYDLLGRVEEKRSPDNSSVSYSYSVSSSYSTSVTEAVTVVLPEGGSTTQTTRKHFNSLGELKMALDANNVPTEYAYDAMGNLRWTQVNNDASTIITMTHDVAGNKRSMVDPDAGALQYTYDGLGLLRSQTNARGQVVTVEYDVLNRRIIRNSPEGLAQWFYDEGDNGAVIGRLSESSSPGYLAEYEYDDLGRLINKATYLNSSGTARQFSYSYDDYSRMSTVTSPSGFIANQQYNAYGYLTAIEKSNGEAIWQARAWDAFGNITSEAYGNDLATTRTYSPFTGLLEKLQTGKTDQVGNRIDQTVQYLTYQYDSLGNLHSRRSQRDSREDLQETFSYDALNRLRSAVTTGLTFNGRELSYDYDALGNIVYKSDVGIYRYQNECDNGAGPHAVCATEGTLTASYNYDDSGNMTQNGNRSLTYTSFNKPQVISEGDIQTEFQYGPDHQRYFQRLANGGDIVETYYIDNYEELIDRTTGITKKKTYINGVAVHIETVENNTNKQELLYLHADHLGSTESITDAVGRLVQRVAFDPFGQRRADDWESMTSLDINSMTKVAFDTTSKGFTGHEQLDRHNFTHMGGRLYDPRLGRFMSVDPFIQVLEDSQNYNRYSYVINNPLKFIDPTGYQLEEVVVTGTRYDDPFSLYNQIIHGYVSPNYLEGFIPRAFLSSAADNQHTDEANSSELDEASADPGQVENEQDQYNESAEEELERELMRSRQLLESLERYKENCSGSTSCSSSSYYSLSYMNTAHMAKDGAMTAVGMVADELIRLPKGVSLGPSLGIFSEIAFQSNNPYRKSSDIWGSFVGSVAGGGVAVFTRDPIAGATVAAAVSQGASRWYEVFLSGPPRAEDYWRTYTPSGGQ